MKLSIIHYHYILAEKTRKTVSKLIGAFFFYLFQCLHTNLKWETTYHTVEIRLIVFKNFNELCHVLLLLLLYIKRNNLKYYIFQTTELKPGSSMAFTFQTVTPNAMILFSSDPKQNKFLSLELYDGRLYLVTKFGRENTRIKLLDNANDGQPHMVCMASS